MMIGYDVFTANGSQWRRLHGAIIPWRLPHVPVLLDQVDAKKLLRQESAYLIRWENLFDLPAQTEWWHIIKDRDPELSKLAKKTRYQVRQGQKNFDVRPCDRELIVELGHEVYVSAFDRYETFEECFDEAGFRAAIRNMPPNIEFWGVFDAEDGRLHAFAENLIDENACFYSTMWFSPASLKRYAAYALVQAMNEYYLDERGFSYVSDGARNLSHATNVHQFLQDKFGFRKAYARLDVVYSPLVGLLVCCLYPFRPLLRRISFLSRLSVLLEQERVRRACKVDAGR